MFFRVRQVVVIATTFPRRQAGRGEYCTHKFTTEGHRYHAQQDENNRGSLRQLRVVGVGLIPRSPWVQTSLAQLRSKMLTRCLDGSVSAGHQF